MESRGFFSLFFVLGGVYYPMFVEKSDLIMNWHGENPFEYRYLMVMGLMSGDKIGEIKNTSPHKDRPHYAAT
jgi:hypothetical protein